MLIKLIARNLQCMYVKKLIMYVTFVTGTVDAMENKPQHGNGFEDFEAWLFDAQVISHFTEQIEKTSLVTVPKDYLPKFKELMLYISEENINALVQLLLSARTDIDTPRIELLLNLTDSETGHLPLTLAVEIGNYEIIRLLKINGAAHDIYNGNNLSALDIAQIKMVENPQIGSQILDIFLLSEEEICNATSNFDTSKNAYNKLIDALQKNDSTEVKEILKQHQHQASLLVNQYNIEYECFPLNLALTTQNLTIIKLLIDAKADPKLIKSIDIESLLNEEERTLSPLQKILVGAAQNDTNATALRALYMSKEEIFFNIMKAIKKNKVDDLRQLIMCATIKMPDEMPYILNQIDKDTQHNPLTLAIHLNKTKCLQLLLIHGADMHKKNGQGLNALEIAHDKYLTENSTESKLYLERYTEFVNAEPEQQAKMLIHQLLDLIRNLYFYKALCLINDFIIPKFLSSIKEIINFSDAKHSLLTLATKKQHYGLVAKLLRLGANPLLPNNNGKSAYEIALHKNKVLGLTNSSLLVSVLEHSCEKFFE